MNRAERRRELRKAGARRSPRKGGRRASVRVTDAGDHLELPTLAAGGFVVATPKVVVPGK